MTHTWSSPSLKATNAPFAASLRPHQPSTVPALLVPSTTRRWQRLALALALALELELVAVV